jgi:hypothetical protein
VRKAYRTFTAIGGILFVLCGASREAAAGDSEIERETLRGLTGVLVLVETIEAEIQHKGLDQKQLQTDTELRLRGAGIKVLTPTEREQTPGKPFLYINVGVLKTEHHPDYACSLHVELAQAILLERNTAMHSTGATWSQSAVLAISEDNLESIRDAVRTYVDGFINAYLSVNPKQSTKR